MVSARLGMNQEAAEVLRQAESDAGERDGLSPSTLREIRESKRKTPGWSGSSRF